MAIHLHLLLAFAFGFRQVLSSPIQSPSEQECRTDDHGIYKGMYNSESQDCCNGNIENKRPGLVCCNGEFNLKKSAWKCCTTRTGQELYNPAENVCCNGSVHERELGRCEHNYCDGHSEEVWVDSVTQTLCWAYSCGTLVEGIGECCGSDKVHDPKTEQCCIGDDNFSTVTPYDAQTVALGHQSHFSCCGSGSTLRSYNKLDEVCCNGIVHPRTPFHKCCGDQYLDERTHLCCKHEDPYRRTVTASSFLKQNGRTKCCQMAPYNPRTESCYLGEVTSDFGYGKPCPTVGIFNPTTSSCCNRGSGKYKLSTNIPKVPHIQDCCGGEAFFDSMQMCCGNTLYDRTAASQTCCGGAPINTDTHFCLRDTPTPNFHNICGSRLYDIRNQTCCGSELFDVANGQCCGESGAYDPANQTCCRGRDWTSAIHSGGNQEGKCCGEQLLQDNQLCVRESGFTLIVDIADNPDHNMWCYGGDKYRPEKSRIFTYDSSKKACSSNGYLTSLYEGESVCGGRTYDTTSQLCCGGLVLAKVKNSAVQKCCPIGVRSYNPATQQCDGGVVSELGELCGNTRYNSHTEVCALGGMCVRNKEQAEHYPKFCGDGSRCFEEERWYDPAEKSCCAGQLVNPRQMCCNGIVQPIPNPEWGNGLCCNGIAYNDYTHLCCDGTLHNITNNKDLECCRKQTIDPNDSSLICCADNLWKTGGADMVCTGGVAHRPVPDEQTLCSNLVMDTISHLCCENNIYPKSEGTHCCGNLPYNPDDPSQLCCMGSRHLNAEGKQCCKYTAIDPNIKTCRMQGGIEYGYPKADAATYSCSNGSYDDTQHTCCEGVLHHGIVDGQCCGTEIVRNSTQICCGGRLHVGNPNTEICCGGKLKKKKHSNAICCGSGQQDGDQFRCCGDQRLRRYDSNDKCCNGVKYLTYENICQNGALRPLHTTTASPTTLSTTNPRPTTEIATSEVIRTEVVTSELVPTTGLVPPVPVTAPSCGGTSYNQTASICCEDKILPRFEGYRNCCSNAIYNTRTQICKNGKIRRIRNGMTCGVLYGEGEITHCNSFVCCNNTFHRIHNERNQCCGNDTFNPSKQECCGGVVINSKQSRCCDGKPYEVGKDVCCQGVLFNFTEVNSHLHLKSGRCFREDCKTCNQKHHDKFWKKKICEKRYLLSASITSYKLKESRFIFEARRITELDQNTAQWQDKMKDIRVVIDGGCKCQWVTRLLDEMTKKGDHKKEFLIMTDEEVVKGKHGKRLVLAEDDFIMETDQDKQGKAFKKKIMGCKRDMPSG